MTHTLPLAERLYDLKIASGNSYSYTILLLIATDYWNTYLCFLVM